MGGDGAATLLRYRVLRHHAQGGLGQVYVAHDEELHREVALKEIQQRYADDPQSRARFLLEAEITGRLEHPGIVPVYGLGAYPDGRPYYAMRFVEGDSLKEAISRFHETEAIRGHKPTDGERTLALRELLDRFVAMCNAVAYAHSRGVLHRDLKPGNVMLGKYGETLVVDWGLAKPVGRPESAGSMDERTLRPSAGIGAAGTQAGSAVGTPAYMSPEQAAGRLEQLGPASDVYSLGATLYCLLTGKVPFKGAEAREVLERVQRGEFLPPRRVNATVPPVLEAICLKAMALAPGERYASPKQLADDIEHWLADEPVAAYREPWLKRAGRWGRRHRTLVASLAVFGGSLLVASLVAAGLLARANAETHREWTRAEDNLVKAQAQAARAEATVKFLTDDLLAEASPAKNPRQKQVTVEEVLNRAAQKMDKAFVGQPEVEAAVRAAVGLTYLHLGQYPESEAHLRRALELCRQLYGLEHLETLAATNNLARLLQDHGKLEEAEPLYRENLEAMRRVLGPNDPKTLRAVNNLAGVVRARGKLEEAEPLFRQNLEAQRRILGPDHPQTLGAVNNLAGLLMARGKLEEAEPLYHENLEALRRVLGPDHPNTLLAVNNLAGVLHDRGKLEEAELLLNQNLEAQRSVLGPDHPNTLMAVNNLAFLLKARGKFEEAEHLFRQNLETQRRILGPDHPQTLGAVNNLAFLLQACGRLDETERLFRQNMEALRRVLGPDHPNTLLAVNNLAVVVQDRGKLDEAEPLFREALDGRRRVLGRVHPQTADSLFGLGDLLTSTGRAGEAEPLLTEALAIRRKTYPKGHERTALTESQLGECLSALGRHADAEPLLVSGYEALKAAKGVSPGELNMALSRLVKLSQRPTPRFESGLAVHAARRNDRRCTVGVILYREYAQTLEEPFRQKKGKCELILRARVGLSRAATERHRAATLSSGHSGLARGCVSCAAGVRPCSGRSGGGRRSRRWCNPPFSRAQWFAVADRATS
jgi:tetratricopeptide (TPR) repeat protein/tRNA A-37 threonylcarbamoyl transferase component Bud32